MIPLRTRLDRYAAATAAPGPYEGFTSTWHPGGGLSMHARVATGPGVPVVLVHGLAVSHRYLMPTAVLLARRHPVGVPDLPGFGLSDDPGSVLSTRRLADALGDWLVAADLSPAVLLGNSYGCQVIADLVVRRPELAVAVVLTGPTIDPQASSAPRQVGRWLRDAVREDPLQLPILLRDAREAGVRRILGTLRNAVAQHVELLLPRILVPALVVRGGIEPIVPPRWAAEAAALLPYGEGAELPGAPHNSGYVAPEALTALVEDFLDRVLAD